MIRWLNDRMAQPEFQISLRSTANAAPCGFLPVFRPAHTLCHMLDKSFAKWWLNRVVPFKDVAPEKLAAEREAMASQQEFNRNYAEFLNHAVLPAGDNIVKTLRANGIVHRASRWGNQLLLRGDLAWRWAELADDHPLCRQCGFDLTGKPETSTQCSECGTDLSGPRAIRIGHRRALRPLVGTGTGMLLLGAVGIGLGGWIIVRGVDVQQYK